MRATPMVHKNFSIQNIYLLTLNWLIKVTWSLFCLMPRSFFRAWLLPLDFGLRTYKTATVPFFSDFKKYLQKSKV